MSKCIESLEHDLTALILRHNTVTGREFQAACLHIAAGYYDPDDLDEYADVAELARALAPELEKHPLIPGGGSSKV